MSTTRTSVEPSAEVAVACVPRASRRTLFWSGLALAVASIAAFVGQVFWANVLVTPWYLPIGGTAAAIMVLWSAGPPLRWWRAAVALVCIALAGLEWQFLLAGSLLPRYAGPMAIGGKIPAFQATTADGKEIDESFFEQGRPTAIIFIQGRWCPFCMTHLRHLEANHAQLDGVGAAIVVVSIEDVDTAAITQTEFPHLSVVSDERRELSNAIEVINKGFSPDGGDSDAPTVLLLDRKGAVQWIHRPTRFIERPSAGELAAIIERLPDR